MEMLYNARQPMGATGLPEAAIAGAPWSGCAGSSAAATSRVWSQPAIF